MDDITNKKDKYRALTGTILFHGVLLVCFLLFGLSTPLPLPEEHGVIVSLGYMDEGTGQFQPLRGAPPVPESSPARPVAEPDQVVTQQTVESVALPEEVAETRAEREQPVSERTDPVPVPVETTERQVEQEPPPVPDPRALFPGRDQRTTERQDQGDTGRAGAQGRVEGVMDANAFDGVGQGGIEYSLSGRQANFLPLPEYTTQATGRVVVTITVNRQGQVIRATAGARGTTTTDQTLHRLAEEAARRARFDLQTGAPEEQVGTITYNFIRQN